MSPEVKKIFDYTLSILIVCSLIIGLAWVMMSTAAMPDVYVSNSTGECVEVINYDEKFDYTCENLPEKYNHVWVK